MDTSMYRGYFIYVTSDGSLWSFRAEPATSELPILPKVINRPHASREAALTQARRSVDYLLSIYDG